MLLAIVACVVSLARAQFQEFVVPDFKGFHDPLAGRRQISCGAPGTPVFGRIASQTGNKPGDTVRCACPENSHAVRHVAGCSARCNLRTHACTLVLTLPHAPSRSLALDLSLSSSHPVQVTYVCSPGHKLVGPAKKKCTQQGYWAPGRVPQCKVIIKRENDNSFQNNDAGWVIGQSNV